MQCVDLGESFLFELDSYSNAYLLAKFGFDTAENGPCKVCPLSAYRSPRFRIRERDFLLMDEGISINQSRRMDNGLLSNAGSTSTVLICSSNVREIFVSRCVLGC